MNILKTLFLLIFVSSIHTSSLHSTIQDLSFQHWMQSYPIMQPTYDGVEQVMVLSDRWVVVVTKNTNQTKEQLIRLSKGGYNSNPQKAINEYWIQAREATGERKLDRTDFYTIKGQGGSNFEKNLNPKSVVRWVVPIDDEPWPGFVADFAQYSYLELPKPLVSGSTYTITLKYGQKVTFTYDEMHTVSQAIEVNQMGYLPDVNPKYAYLSLYVPTIGTPASALPAQMTFEVVDARSGEVVFTGPVQLREKEPVFNTKEKQPLTGTTVYQMNLGALQTEGYYFIKIPHVGRSWPFRVGEEAYADAFYTSARGLFHQRASTSLEEPFTSWTRDQCDWGKIYDSPHLPFINNVPAPNNYRPFDVLGHRWQQIKGKLNSITGSPNLPGGWHDAGDYDRRLQHYTAIFDLLNLYEMKPTHFTDGQLNLPESSNGIPDLLDEAEFGLRVWKNSQDAKGGIAGAVETIGHVRWCDPNIRWFYSKSTRWASFLYAAAAAQFAKIVDEFDPELAQSYEESAVRAYTFAIDSKNSVKGENEWAFTIPAAENRGQGKNYQYKWGEKWDFNIPYSIAARLQLFRLTKDSKYLEPFNQHPESALLPMLEAELTEHKRGPYQRPTFREQDFSPWLYYGVLTTELQNFFPKKLINQYRDLYINKAAELVSYSKNMPYRRSKDRKAYGKMAWGFGTMTHQARALLIAYDITNLPEFRRVATYNLDYMLGANPLGLSWTTGVGWAYPVPIQHGISRDVLSVDEPIPGITLYGPTAHSEYGGSEWKDFQGLWGWNNQHGKLVWFVNKDGKYHPTPIPLLRRWIPHPRKVPAQNEFTIHETMSAGIFVIGYLMEENWVPANYLLDRKPRPRSELFGYWYLP